MKLIVQYHDVPRDFLPRNPSLSQLLPGDVSVSRADQTSMHIEIESGEWAGFQIRLSGENFTYLGGIPTGGEIDRLELHVGELGKTLDIFAQTDDGAATGTNVILSDFWEKIRDGDSLAAQQLFRPRGRFDDLFITGSDGDDNIMDWIGISSYWHMDGGNRNDIPDLDAGAGDDYLSDIVWNYQNLGFGYVLLGDGNDTVVGVTGIVLGGAGNDTFHDVGSNGNMGSGVLSYRGGEGDDIFLSDKASYFIYADGGNGFDRVVAIAPYGTFQVTGANLEMYSVSARSGNTITMNILPDVHYVSGVPGATLKGTGGAGDFSSLQADGFARMELSFVLGAGDSLIATEFDDTVSGGSDGTIHMGGGNDFFSGGARNMVFGGTGDDLFGIASSQPLTTNRFDGGTGTDGLRYSGNVAVNLDMQAATDAGWLINVERIETGAGNDVVSGDGFDNIFALGLGLNDIDGRGGNDRVDYSHETNAISAALQGSQPTWIMVGGSERDYVRNIESILAGSANDTLVGDGAANMFHGGLGNDRLTGNDGADTLNGWIGDDTLDGAAGDDLLISRAGNDHLDGGTGEDTAQYVEAYGDVSIYVDGAALLVDSPYGFDRVVNVEWFQFSDQILHADEIRLTAPNFILGTQAAEVLSGTPGNDFILGLGGSDWIRPGQGNDTVDGGEGFDMVDFSDQPWVDGYGPGVYMSDIDLTAGVARLLPGDTNVLVSIERATGTIYADTMKGSAGADHLRGLGDYDWFIATTGADTIDGGSGLDMVSFIEWAGGAQATVTDITQPFTVDFNGVHVDLTNPANNTALAASLTLESVERVTGSSYQDIFWGDDGQNDFRGLGGYDFFVGSTGGRERYYGDAGRDTVTYYQSTSGVSASLRNGPMIGGEPSGYGYEGDAALDLYFSIENLIGSRHNDNLTGNDLVNQLRGLGGDDLIFGYGGNDRLRGDAGNDTIDGGAGSDFAVFSGNRADYTLTRTSRVDVTVDGRDGTDQLVNVEYFIFDDQMSNIWELAIV